MADTTFDLDRHLATRVRELRSAHGLSLDALAARSGVSRSMISLVERGESSPTAAILNKIATALGITLAALFDAASPGGSPGRPPAGPVARRRDQPEWTDPGSGYVRRNVSPPGSPQPMQIVEVRFPPRGRVAFDNSLRLRPPHQQIWILEGTMEVTVGTQRHRLDKGDCLAMQVDRPTLFHNPTRRPARYAVVIASASAGRNR